MFIFINIFKFASITDSWHDFVFELKNCPIDKQWDKQIFNQFSYFILFDNRFAVEVKIVCCNVYRLHKFNKLLSKNNKATFPVLTSCCIPH